MKKFTIDRTSSLQELPPEIVPKLALMKIRITSEGYPETGSLYFEGLVRTFVLERLPHPTLIALLPRLLTEPSFTYAPGKEILQVERIEKKK